MCFSPLQRGVNNITLLSNQPVKIGLRQIVYCPPAPVLGTPKKTYKQATRPSRPITEVRMEVLILLGRTEDECGSMVERAIRVDPVIREQVLDCQNGD
jgi:hypothetical protein